MHIIRLIVLFCAALAGFSCAFMNARLGLNAVTGDCLLVPGTPWGDASITVGLTDDLDPAHAPRPTTDSERLLFAHLFETLVTVDCGGTVRPGLASAWESSEGRRVWTFTLREGARFSDGTQISAEHVRRAWAAARVSTPGPWLWVDSDSVQILDETRFRVALSRGSDRFPAVFAHPSLSIVKRESAKGWPVGSGPYLISLDRIQEIRCLPNPNHPDTKGRSAPLRFVVRPGADSRDLLGGEVDVLMVREKAAVEYADNLSEYTVYPASWGRTYFLFSRYGLDEEFTDRFLTQTRKELSEEVVLAEGKPENRTLFLEHLPGGDNRLNPTSEMGRIAFSQMDSDAARISERLVAVAREPVKTGGPELFRGGALTATVVGLEEDEFDLSLMTGRERGYVFSVPRMLSDLSDDLELRFMSWGLLKPAIPGPVYGVDCVPLLSTRSYLVVRKGLVGLVKSGGGTVLVHRAGWEKRSALP